MKPDVFAVPLLSFSLHLKQTSYMGLGSSSLVPSTLKLLPFLKMIV